MNVFSFRQQGFTLIELIVVILMISIISLIAAPKLLDLSADAKSNRILGIRASVTSGIEISHAKMIILGHDNGMSDTPIDIDNDGKGDLYSLYGYPVILNDQDLKQVLDSDICIDSEDTNSCKDNKNRFRSKTIVNNALLGDVDYFLHDMGAENPELCFMVVQNAKLSYSTMSESYALQSAPQIIVEISGC